MTRVVLGNHHAVHSRDNGETFEQLKGKRALIIDPDPGDPITDIMRNITHENGLWSRHAAAGSKPAWVASDDELLAKLLGQHYGCEVRDLEDVKTKDGVIVPGGAIPAMLMSLMSVFLALPVLAFLVLRVQGFLKTNAGNDVQAAQMAGSASATAVLKWVALTANGTAPGATDTTLTGEIATGGGGLVRKAGTYAHTTGAASYTITTTFTANGSDSLPVTIAKRGIFDAASSGNMGFETLLSPTTATMSASGDQLTLTDTIST